MITPAQIRAGRALLGWSQARLAKASGLSLTGFSNIERGAADPKSSTLATIQRVLEAAGIDFVEGGARLAAQQQPTEKAKGSAAQ